jgi:hypothetical protein
MIDRLGLLRAVFLFLSLLFISAEDSAVRAQDAAKLRFSAPLTMRAADKTSLISLTLGTEVFANSESGFADLRLYDSTDKLVSFLIRQQVAQREERVQSKRSIPSPNLKFLDGNGLEIDFTIDPGKSASSLTGVLIRTELREFERRASLEWDQGRGEWVKLVSDVLLYDYSSVLDLRNLEIRLPQPLELSQPAKFRLTIDKVTEVQEGQVVELTRRLRGADEEYREERLLVNRQPFKIQGLESCYETKRTVNDSPLNTSYPVKLVSQNELKDEHTTELIIESQNEPLIGFQLRTEDDNFSRNVKIEIEKAGSADQTSRFHQVGTGTISKIHLAGSELDRTELTFPETRSQRYRLTLANLDSPPLKISEVIATGNCYQLYFLAQPGERYRLEYGGGESQAPSFDTLAIRTALEQRAESLTATLGEASNVQVAAAVPPKDWTVPIWMYWLIGLCLVALLASSLYNAAKRIDMTE